MPLGGGEGRVLVDPARHPTQSSAPSSHLHASVLHLVLSEWPHAVPVHITASRAGRTATGTFFCHYQDCEAANQGHGAQFLGRYRGTRLRPRSSHTRPIWGYAMPRLNIKSMDCFVGVVSCLMHRSARTGSVYPTSSLNMARFPASTPLRKKYGDPDLLAIQLTKLLGPNKFDIVVRL